jgi:hypothetical protein
VGRDTIITTPHPRLKEKICWVCGEPTVRYGEICVSCAKNGFYFDMLGELKWESRGDGITYGEE